MANGYEDIQVEISGDLYKVPGVRFRDDEHLYNLCSSMLQAVGRKINVREPTADGKTHQDKSRINVTHPNIGGGKTNHPTSPPNNFMDYQRHGRCRSYDRRE